MCFNKVEGPKTLRRHTLVKTSITQITGDFIKKIGEIFKESEKLYETEEAYEENLELYEQLTGSLIMQNPDRAETISQNVAYLQRFLKGIGIFYASVSSSLPQVRKRANVCRRTINIKETQKHEKPLNNRGHWKRCVFHKRKTYLFSCVSKNQG